MPTQQQARLIRPEVALSLPQVPEDTIPREYRHWRLRQALANHRANREWAQHQVLGHTVHLYLGPRGAGKTTDLSLKLLFLFELGFFVVSNGLGLLFGVEVPERAFYNMHRKLPRGTAIGWDEIHNAFPTNAASTTRGRMGFNAMTGMRKNDQRLDGATSTVDSLSPTLKRATEWWHYPRPARSQRGVGRGIPAWCRRAGALVGPYPIRTTDEVAQAYDIEYHDQECQKYFTTVRPSAWYDAAACQYSWQNVKDLMAGAEWNSASMLDDADSDDAITLDLYDDDEIASGNVDGEMTADEVARARENQIWASLVSVYNQVADIPATGPASMIHLANTLRDMRGMDGGRIGVEGITVKELSETLAGFGLSPGLKGSGARQSFDMGQFRERVMSLHPAAIRRAVS